MSLTHTEIAWRYAEDVVEGRVLACRLTQLSCQRFLDDLGREDFEYEFDAEAADRACNFIETLPHTKGEWAMRGETIKLEPWQVFIVASVFGWLHKETGKRRFRTCYVEVPRKNGKSAISAGVGLYMMLLDGEHGAEVYSGATNLDQAHAVFEPAWLMAHKNAALRKNFGVELGGTKKNPGPIYCAKTSSRFEPVIGKPGDGASPSCAIVDEYHEHQSEALFDTMETGMGARQQPLMWVITTAGSDTAGPCYALRTNVVQMLEGTVPNERLFGVIYTIDEGDDWKSEEALRKANPNYGISVQPDHLRKQVAEAVSSSRKQNAVKTKHLNVWTTAMSAWMNMEAWNACADSSLSPEQFASEPCWFGVDLASKVDIASAVKVFRRRIGDEWHYYLFGRHYLPEARVEHPDRRHYQGWVHDGHLIATEGDIIDESLIQGHIEEDAEAHRIVRVGYDPWGARTLAVNLEEAGIPTLEIRQTVKFLSEPMKWLEAYTLAGRIHHDGNPCMNWMVSNVLCRTDANDNIHPRKDETRDDLKIDGAVAAIIALCVAMREEEPTTSVYTTRGIRTL